MSQSLCRRIYCNWRKNMQIKEELVYMKPYARLLTMLGDQLIRDETVALAEIIKNSYDADAEKVLVYFENFKQNGDELEQQDSSRLVIKDNGCGMDENVIKKHWLNPATPIKKFKKQEVNEKTAKGRIIQGEKGIGRYSLLKLGNTITITTRPINSDKEYVLEYNFAIYEEDFFDSKTNNYLYLDSIPVKFVVREPVEIIKDHDPWSSHHGTKIEISGLKGIWSSDKIAKVLSDIGKLRPIFDNLQNNVDSDFDVCFLINGKKILNTEIRYVNKINDLMENRAILKIKGQFIEKSKTFFLDINNKEEKITLQDPKITGLTVYKKFMNARGQLLPLEVGPFSFEFYVFDFSANVPEKYKVDREDRDIIKQNRVYLYRDGIRVYPYGAANDDWLGIDIYRGTVSAGGLLSNDQIIGCVSISQKYNPNLEDATSREGLLNNQASQDFVGLLKILLAYIRAHPYKQYQNKRDEKDQINGTKKQKVEGVFSELKKAVAGNKNAEAILNKAENTYKKEKGFLIKRAEMAEDLAGVGLSVETASHDIMVFMNKALEHLDALIFATEQKNKPSYNDIQETLTTVRGAFSFVHDKLKNIQLLFKSSNQRRKKIRIKDVVTQISLLFKRALKDNDIEVSIEQIGKSPLIVQTYDAVIMQVLINLFDNAIYWLPLKNNSCKEIKIILDSNEHRMFFTDNGPGIHPDDEDYIFEPFYSGKGDEGRGLGLYIAKQLLLRNDFSISLVHSKNDQLLSGASFVIDFNKEEE